MKATVSRIHPTFVSTLEYENYVRRVFEGGSVAQIKQLLPLLVERGPYMPEIDEALRDKMYHFSDEECFRVLQYADALTRKVGVPHSGSIELTTAYHTIETLVKWQGEERFKDFDPRIVEKINARLERGLRQVA